MLRPERMSKVSVTGSKRVIDDVIEAVHALNLLDLSDYDGSWEGFEGGRSLESAEETNEQLVTVRALENTLGIEDDDAGQTRIVDREELDAELPELRERINELDDQRGEIETRIREIDEEIEAVEPFAALGLDLDLLSGYDSLAVLVGQGDRDTVAAELDDEETIQRFEIFTGGDTQAIFAQPAEGHAAASELIADALVGVEFTTLSVPDAEDSPEQYVADLESEKETLEAELGEIEAELETVKAESAGFLLAAEEYLTIEAQKKEAPLSFATTANAFVAEGWIPTARYEELAATLADDVDGPVDVDEVERAQFKSNGQAHVEDHGDGGNAGGAVDAETAADAEAATDGGEVVADGSGTVTMADDGPPVVQGNPSASKPFQVLIEAFSRPKYSEFDPTVLVFLTFPAMFGFMIGDVGYGVLYMLIGYVLYTRFDASAFKSLGGVALWAGGFTAIFGVLYDEVFGLHPFAEPMPELLGVGFLTLHKGLKPYYAEWALAWFFVSILVGVLHLNMGYILSFIEDYNLHGPKEAVLESGSWLLMLNGVWAFILSDLFRAQKPEFMFTVFNEGSDAAVALGFGGFGETVGIVGGVAFLVGSVLLGLGEPMEIPEVLNPLVNALSYTRLAAVLLAKAGTAFAVNLIVFGAYFNEGNFHFIFTGSELSQLQAEGAEIMFAGLTTSGTTGLIIGALVLLVGHTVVLALGVTSAGLQAVRLEYVEFFGKFYEGGGRQYTPFGYERTHTTTDESSS
ncbi:V-type ATP synthase subunit I [Halonotius sp. F2-221B]|uniref:V-type ATP synthase subunit I n=1 Tax=Halonotius sp. F2-221B TaxID=2731620 RepID=UPI00398B9D3F